MLHYTAIEIKTFIKQGVKLPLATQNYPSRGQTTVQELYQTTIGKLFLKKVSERNHKECQIDVPSGTLAEREFWAYCLARNVGLFVPEIWLLDPSTTVQTWFDYPDGHIYKTSTGIMELTAKNIFDCVLFDWITGQVDRHDANYLYDFNKCNVIPVDSAHSFLKYEGSMPDYLHLYEIKYPDLLNRRVKSDISDKVFNLSINKIKKMVPLRNDVELTALVKRIDKARDVSSMNDL
ncbi:hypothetical protein KKA47_03165, partial [bacterium]|nr:hypothetical protein [bacterium]